MANDPMKKTLTVEIGPDAGSKDSYEFKIPTLWDEIKIGTQIEKLHRAIDPTWNGFSQGLDNNTLYTLRAAATLELLLLKASVTWPFTPDAKNEPVVDSGKFPEDKAAEAILVYSTFDDALARFRSGGTIPKVPDGTKVVEGESSP
jgi:hypothetical protein